MKANGIASLVVTLSQIAAVLASWPGFMASPVNRQLNAESTPERAAPKDAQLEPEPVGPEREMAPRLNTCTCVREINTLVNQLSAEQARISTIQRQLEELTTSVYTNQEQMQNLQRSSRVFLRSSNQAVDMAFHARLGNSLSDLSGTDVIVFDEVLVNNGGHYDPFSGKVTAPEDGTYHLSATILSDFNATIETMLVVNGLERARIFSGAYGNRGSGSMAATLNLKRGDQAWVALFHGNGDYVHSQWSTFSGFIINAVY